MAVAIPRLEDDLYHSSGTGLEVTVETDPRTTAAFAEVAGLSAGQSRLRFLSFSTLCFEDKMLYLETGCCLVEVEALLESLGSQLLLALMAASVFLRSAYTASLWPL